MAYMSEADHRRFSEMWSKQQSFQDARLRSFWEDEEKLLRSDLAEAKEDGDEVKIRVFQRLLQEARDRLPGRGTAAESRAL